MIGYFIALIQPILLLILFLFITVVVVLPLAVLFFPHYFQFIFFLNFRRLPNTDYLDLSSNNVESIGRSFYLDGKAGKLGVWQILPHDIALEYRTNGIHPSNDEIEEKLKDSKYRIILYAHGNSFDRTFYHRVEMYNILASQNYHVVCFDYRGYGDSEGTPTEHGIVSDARTVYDYVKSKSGTSSVIVWGHSMGTGVSCRLVKDLCLNEQAPTALVLESPFNNLKDAIVNHPIFTIFSWMNDSLVDHIIIKPLNSVGLTMQSDERIKHITCPILILHAEDDRILPVKLGRALHFAAKKSERKIKYHEFSQSEQFGHKFICRSPHLPALIQEFVQSIET